MSTSTLKPTDPLSWIKKNPVEALLLAGIVGTFLYFYAWIQLYGNFREQSVFKWIWAVCGKKEYDYSHGRFIPFVMAFLIWRSRHKIAQAPRRSDWWGLAIMVLGILFYIAAARTIQARIAAGSIPFIIYGLIAFIWGRHVARHFIFPLFLIYFAIPLPGLTQATNGLQLIATKTAYHLSSLLGADVVISGNYIKSATGAWGGGADEGFHIAEGCSGIRSLVALTLIAAVYGHLTQDALWKKIVLFAVSVPIAIVANSLRVTTIVLIAEYGSAEFAKATYHNWSGFLFFPLGLAGLILVGLLINHGFKAFKRAEVRVVEVDGGDGKERTATEKPST